jgi:hypothetical protein
VAAVWMRLRAEIRSHLAATVALALLVGIAGGVVIATGAGARRTDTAFPRFLKASRAADVLVSPNATGFKGFYQDIERLPEVERAGAEAAVYLLHLSPSGQPDFNVIPAAILDGLGYAISRPNLISGRLPNPNRPAEALANRFVAARYHLRPGSTMTFLSFRHEPSDPSKISPSDYVRLTITITGIGVAPNEVVPVAQLDSAPWLLVTPGYFRKYADPNDLGFDGLAVKLKPRADIKRFHREVDALALKHQATIGGPAAEQKDAPPSALYFFADESVHNARVLRAIRPQSIALALFAILAAGAALLALGQIMARQLFVDSTEYPILRGLGMARNELVTLAMIRVAIIAVAGGLIAVVLAFLASPLFPIGPARLAESDPGFSANVAFMGLGFAGIVLSLLAVAAYPAWRGATAASGVLGAAEVPGAERPSRIARAAARGGGSPTVGAGVRMALEPGHGRTAVPVRTALVGLIAAIAAVASAFTYGTSLNRLVSTPRLYGWDWDVFLDAGFGPIMTNQSLREVANDPSVAAMSAGNYGTLTVAGDPVPAVGIESFKGAVYPTIVEGRAPTDSNEIVLGTTSLRRAHASVGETVTVGLSRGSFPMRIVGRAVFPPMGPGSFTPTGLGEGAIVAGNLLIPTDYPLDSEFTFLLVRLVPGSDRPAFRRSLVAQVRKINPDCSEGTGACDPRPVERPADIANYARVRATPLILAGLLAVIAAAMIGHALVTSVRRRRHDLAILKTLGFVRRQVSATVAWQATTFAVIALALGLPIGVAVGRWIWTVFADQLGVPPEPVVSLPVILLAIPATLLLANVIAAIPGRLASRTHPAVVLRTE